MPAAQHARWHELASATPGLTKLELAILDVIAGHYRRLQAEGNASAPSIEMMALTAKVRSVDVTGAIRNLVGLALIAVRPGSGRLRNAYLLCLSKRAAAALATAAAPPPY